MHLRTPLDGSWISREISRGPLIARSGSMHGIEKRTIYIIRSDADPAHHYEKYLKSGSGRAFAKRQPGA